MQPIPVELLEQFNRGNVLLFIGERIVHDPKGRAVVDRLVAQMATRCGIDDEDELSFPEVAQAYEDEKGRHALVEFLSEQVGDPHDEPQRVHHLIAGLVNCNVLVTTCLDRRLERAFAERDRPLQVVIGNVDVAFEDERKAQLYKLCGSVERRESLVLTEDDYETFRDDRASVSVVLQGYLARRTILFMGYDLADPHFKQFYRKATSPLDNYARRAYVLKDNPQPRVRRWCKRHNVEVITTETTGVLEALTKQMVVRPQPTVVDLYSSTPSDVIPLPKRPYKFLDYYEAKDAAIFFGRQQETQRLLSLIHAHRLVLLYGVSGTGKTSVLRAGAMPRLEHADPPYETLYVRALEDPALTIRSALQRRFPEADCPQEGPLVDFLDAVTKACAHVLVIILDQFEEFFIRRSPQSRQAFVAELGALYNAYDVPVKVVLCLREDWLAALDEFESRIPQVSQNKMRLLPLTRDQARQAITEPAARTGVSYEPELVDRLLESLAEDKGATVMPTQLQIVCNTLYDRLHTDERTITLAVYEDLGGARGVLQQYLEDELSRLRGRDRVLADSVLDQLTTSKDTKTVKTEERLALALDVELKDVQPVLSKLVRARLLRTLELEQGGTAYELAHEYLIREIHPGTEKQARKQAEEIIDQEWDNHQRLGTLLSADKLTLVYNARTSIRLTDEEQKFLLQSALKHGTSIDYWLTRMEDPERRRAMLAAASASDDSQFRRHAAAAFALLDEPVSVEPLVELAVDDQDPEVRVAARDGLMSLASHRDEAMARLVKVAVGKEGKRSARALDILAWGCYLDGQPLSLPRRIRWSVHIRLSQINLRTSWLQVQQQVRIGALAAALGILPLATYLAFMTAEGDTLSAMGTLTLFVLLAGMAGMLLGGGMTVARVSTRDWPRVFRVTSIALAGGLCGLFLSLVYLNPSNLIVGLALGLVLAGIDVTGFHPGRWTMAILGAVLSLAVGLARALVTDELSEGNTPIEPILSVVAVAVLMAVVSEASVLQSRQARRASVTVHGSRRDQP